MPIKASLPGPLPQVLQVATQTDFEAQGFPARMVTAFSDTATALQQVILSRVPGVTTTSLIEARFDLKSFFIKSKSCDWGPMAGFVCAMPWLNKKGASKAAYNLQELANYLDVRPNITTLGTVFRAPIPAVPAQGDQPAQPAVPAQGARPGGAFGAPFIPLRFPLSRVVELAMLPNFVLRSPNALAQAANTPIYGVAFNADKSAATDFLLRPVDPQPPDPYFVAPPAAQNQPPAQPEPLWELLHANVWVLGANKRFTRIVPATNPFDSLPVVLGDNWMAKWDRVKWTADAIAAIKPQFGYPFAAPADDDTALDRLYAAADQAADNRGILSDAPSKKFVPVLGCCNPFPPYVTYAGGGKTAANPADPKLSTYYRNAVSGDYDLFAVWQRIGMPSIVRVSEQSPPRALFAGSEKRFALTLTANPNVYVEFVPGFAEMGALEAPQYGNSNDAVTDAVQWLNNTVGALYGSLPVQPNAAFHSDEGGRPGVADLGYPIAMFLPEAFGGGSFVLKDDRALLAAMTWLRNSCRVAVQAVWLGAMAANAHLQQRPADAAPAADEGDVKALVLGPPPANGYTADQAQLYGNYLALVGNTYGAFDPAQGEFDHATAANPVAADMTAALALTSAAPAALAAH